MQKLVTGLYGLSVISFSAGLISFYLKSGDPNYIIYIFIIWVYFYLYITKQ